MKIIVAGGSGGLGRRVCADLGARGHDIVVLTRAARQDSAYRQIEWDGKTVGSWAAELAGAAVINLCGALVDRAPSLANVALLTRSRVEPTTALMRAADGLETPLVAWIQMSTLAIYGDAGDAVLDESARPADGPAQMPGVARPWEEAAAGARAARQVILRTGIVLDPLTPAMKRLTGLVRFGLGGRIGTGNQWVSWLHIADFQAIVRTCLDDQALTGIVHATSPNPVSNAELMSALRHVLHRPAAPPTPAWLLRLGAFVSGSDPALALTGRRCVPAALTRAGFEFAFPDLGPALRDLLAPGS
jgi:uncharacterized protein (TIGR01777 family)